MPERVPPEGIDIGSSTESLTYQGDCLDEQITVENVRRRLEYLVESERKQRDILVFLLHVFDGLSAREIAEHQSIGLTLSGVESLLRRLKILLKQSIEAEWKDPQ